MKTKEEIKWRLENLYKMCDSFMSIEKKDFERIHSIQDKIKILEWVLK
jgi:hypothetical protein